MNGIMKVLTGILAVLAVTASLATAGIIGYSIIRPEENTSVENAGGGSDSGPEVVDVSTAAAQVPTAVPQSSSSPEASASSAAVPSPIAGAAADADHVHDYKESVDKKATCYSAGRIKYTCEECGDTYYVDVMSTGHVAGDWEVVKKPVAGSDGVRVQKCIYCDEIIAQESISYHDGTSAEGEAGANHIHQYTASTEREPTCTLAGLRKYSCSCGNFYTESIPALGHVATDWDVAAEATTTRMGTEQRTCAVCGVLLDSRPVNKLTPSPAASASGNPTASAAAQSATPAGSGGSSPQPTSAPTASPEPTATPHTHEYQSYVLKQPNCTEIGVRSFVCTCGSSYAEVIERDLNNHTFRAVIIPATSATQGYTAYTCVRCNYSYFDNYTPALNN